MKSAALPLCLSLILFCGCKTSRHAHRPVPAKRPVAELSISGLTLKGAVITRINAGTIFYQERCAYCGYLSPEEHCVVFASAPWSEGSILICPKCGKKTDVIIRRAR